MGWGSKRSGKAQSQRLEYWKDPNDPRGYYYLLSDTARETPYFLGSDGIYHRVIQVWDTTGRLTPEHRAQFIRYMIANNNSFRNAEDELVEFDRAIITTEEHHSTAVADPYINSGVAHTGIQLSNEALRANDSSSHLLHWRRLREEFTHFYPDPMTRTQVSTLQNKRYGARYDGRNKDKNNKRHPPSGGAGANTGRGGGTSGSSKQGRGGSSSSQQSSGHRRGYGGGSSSGSQSRQATGQPYLNQVYEYDSSGYPSYSGSTSGSQQSRSHGYGSARESSRGGHGGYDTYIYESAPYHTTTHSYSHRF